MFCLTVKVKICLIPELSCWKWEFWKWLIDDCLYIPNEYQFSIYPYGLFSSGIVLRVNLKCCPLFEFYLICKARGKEILFCFHFEVELLEQSLFWIFCLLGVIQKHKFEDSTTMDKHGWSFRKVLKLSDINSMDELTETLARVVRSVVPCRCLQVPHPFYPSCSKQKNAPLPSKLLTQAPHLIHPNCWHKPDTLSTQTAETSPMPYPPRLLKHWSKQHTLPTQIVHKASTTLFLPKLLQLPHYHNFHTERHFWLLLY